ncbi:MAG: hypothetical protein WC409_06240 [Candidatus Omnitrophota bacterium]|jgi:hypothetical protein|nr:hypothetical protein [Candidatus Omnitrophota bacterium]MDD5137869.1 hypothetical protein [Candidatus Omnitrophota bacterium]MDD5538911.1 hypothetical protein [Candidatus Omnitrophota bacterium]
MKTIALIAAVVLPLWNIPLIVKIHRRRSAEDFSRSWALGVWVCLALMFPAAMRSDDIVFKTYSIVNIILFSMVVGWVLRFKRKTHH